MLEAGSGTGYRRLGDVSAQIERLAPHRWHVTITVRKPGTSELDETIPIIDLGIFPTTETARDAADLTLDHCNSA